MRIPKHWVPTLSKSIIDNLVQKHLIEPQVPVAELIEKTGSLLLDELTVEDRLNDEVRHLLKKYESEIEKGRLDYRKLFDMTKQKLIKEQNLIL
jgi:hypothetical protein